ncbi:GDSL-type esterase/lipase family protein [Luteimonas sp. BDR2-5]|uniref:SGNH/GDSL hydrolase family protein n=1 Tax=Proluteimonas luteida TaxID=2878685 RepID=UPI001E552A41|nr:SGNH/GDSL hydrolase family protein [Luteimonas sp. BDR2-5]MCD9028902.1 GDSL-type esterase/lipase family protein [Luteimonas sp. BDR2-5]
MSNLRLRCCAAPLFAALLALAGCTGTGVGRAIDTPEAVEAPLDPVSSPDWARDMARFAAEDAATPPPERPVVFTGSSSVRMWTTLAQDFSDVPVLNRGFGGSQVRDAVWYADEIAVRYRPRQIVLYAGDNDIDAGRTPQQVLADTRAFVARVRRDLPGTSIALLAIKPSPLREGSLDAQRTANDAIRDWAATQKNVAFIDVFTPMLDADGRPRGSLFLEDRLHLNADGYALWRGIVEPYLVR